TFPPNRSEMHVELKPISGEEEEMEKTLRKVLESFPGVTFEVMTFLGDRIGESISGETQPVVINVFGSDLDVLDAKAAEVQKILEGIHGAKEVQVKAPPGTPRMAVKLRPDSLVQFGFRPVDVLEAIQTAYQ